MDDNVITILEFNSFIYKLYIIGIFNKKNIEIKDLVFIYGLLIYTFSIDLFMF